MSAISKNRTETDNGAWDGPELRQFDSQHEVRSFPMQELRVLGGDGEPARIVGHAAVFNMLSVPLWGFRERVRPGAFSRTIQTADVRALWNHDVNYVLGRTKSRTLRLFEDAVGLRIEADPPETSWARDALVSMRRGDVDQMSFAFDVVQDELSTENGETIRDLWDVDLYDVSPVTFPAYPQTDVAVRSALQSLGIPASELIQVLSRSRVGDISDEDREWFIRHIWNLQGYLSSGGDGQAQEGQPEDVTAQARARLDVLRRRLEIAELS